MSVKKEAERLASYLEISGINLFEVSRKTGVSYNTIRAIKYGTGNPTVSTLTAIEDYLCSKQPEKSCETCDFCAAFDRTNKEFGCILFGGSTDGEEPDACMMHKES